MSLPTISTSSAGKTTPTDALKAALGFQRQKEARLKAAATLSKDSKSLRRIEVVVESDEECEEILGVVADMHLGPTKTQRRKDAVSDGCVSDVHMGNL